MFRSISAFFDGLLERGGDKSLGADELQIATTALLVHAIAIDGRITEAETERLQSLLAAHFQLPGAKLQRLLDVAELREREAVDIFRFTSVLRDSLALEEKRLIIEMMWRAVYADGELDPLEDNLIWRTAELLAVPARDRMELKRKVRGESEAGSG